MVGPVAVKVRWYAGYGQPLEIVGERFHRGMSGSDEDGIVGASRALMGGGTLSRSLAGRLPSTRRRSMNTGDSAGVPACGKLPDGSNSAIGLLLGGLWNSHVRPTDRGASK